MCNCSCDVIYCVYVCVFVHACFVRLFLPSFYLELIGYLLIVAIPQQQMEWRSDRIRQHRERAADMEVHDEEE